jgi:hypothetical protein
MTRQQPGAFCRYRRWALNSEAGIDIVVRCEIDGVINNKGEDQLLSIKVRLRIADDALAWHLVVVICGFACMHAMQVLELCMLGQHAGSFVWSSSISRACQNCT